MDEIIVGNSKQLYEKLWGIKDIYIYGAKTIGRKIYTCIESFGINVQGFMVSNRYDNCNMLFGKEVYRIEDYNKKIECLVLAVNENVLWQTRDELLRYNINKLIIVSPFFNLEESIRNLSSKCKISNKSYMGEQLQLIADETSSIIIDDYTIINNRCVIKAFNNSHIHIHEGCMLDKDVLISADNMSEVNINDAVSIGYKSKLVALDNSLVNIKSKCKLLEQSNITSRKKSDILFKEEVLLGRYGIISTYNSAKINIGTKTTIYDYVYMVSEKSNITIGKECMLSYYIKLSVGSHRIKNIKTKEEITKRVPIVIGNNVWIGIDVTILSGCNIEDGSIVGAASVVNNNIPENSTCAGNTVKVLRNEVEWIR